MENQRTGFSVQSDKYQSQLVPENVLIDGW